MSEKTPHKPLVWYGLAMEYRARGQREDAARAFERCVEADPTYVPAYFMWGMTLEDAGQRDRAVAMLRRGITVAGTKGDTHAAGEMQGTLETWGVE
ncbi:MAG: tetratricopeptide repeat protein [Deltaproteobacteria bacterium]|nr:tetratricopeptide repeat protein [Deltaproteobacteria bacterium]